MELHSGKTLAKGAPTQPFKSCAACHQPLPKGWAGGAQTTLGAHRPHQAVRICYAVLQVLQCSPLSVGCVLATNRGTLECHNFLLRKTCPSLVDHLTSVAGFWSGWFVTPIGGVAPALLVKSIHQTPIPQLSKQMLNACLTRPSLYTGNCIKTSLA